MRDFCWLKQRPCFLCVVLRGPVTFFYIFLVLPPICVNCAADSASEIIICCCCLSLSHHASLFWRRYKGCAQTRRSNLTLFCRAPRRLAFRSGRIGTLNTRVTDYSKSSWHLISEAGLRSAVTASDFFWHLLSAVMRPPSELDSSARMPAEAEEGNLRAPAMMICARLAGRAIIRVVGRCEDAQENSQLGKYLFLF